MSRLALKLQANALPYLLPRRIKAPEASIFSNPLPHLSSPKPLQTTTSRAFSLTTSLSKKKSKTSSISSSASSTSSSTSSSPQAPNDFTALESGIAKSIEKLKEELSKLKPGGRFNPEVLEHLRVKIGGKDGNKESYQLGTMAQVLPKGGRWVVVMVGEAEHIKPITTAIQSSSLSLQPVPDPHNPQHLNIPIPPATQESRTAAIAEIGKKGEIASLGIKNARGEMHKKLRSMGLNKTARPDDINKAGKKMEKIVEGGKEEVKRLVGVARKGMETS